MKNKRATILTAFIIITLLASGCNEGKGKTGASSVSSGAEAASAPSEPSAPVGSAQEADTRITLNGSSIQVEGGGAAVDGTTVTITARGSYTVSGTLDSGQIVVAAAKNDQVNLILNGVDITSGRNAAIYCSQADRLVITLEEGTENRVADAADFIYADAAAEEPDACVFSKGDMTINGTGSLTVEAGFHNGIGTKDDLVIESGSITVSAANHGIRGRDSVTVAEGSLAITAENDGIQSNNNEDPEKGWILLSGGSCRITSGHDGIQAETALTVTGGEYLVVAGGGSENTTIVDTESYKALKAGTELVIEGGVLELDSADDGIHANGDVTIREGSFSIASGDDGVHAEGHLEISGGNLEIPASYEGLEGATITIAGGAINLKADDDGVNAAGGSDEEVGVGRFGRDAFLGSDDYWINITGGSLTIDAEGDGIDSNGNITMTGGTVWINGPTGSGNGALDFGRSFELSGGALIAAGSAGMAQTPGEASAQPSLAVLFTSRQEAGAVIALADSTGAEIASFAPAKSWQSIIFSVPELKNGETYTLARNGEELTEVTLSGAVTSVNETGAAVPGGMGFGGMGPGGGTRPEGAVPGGPGGERPAPGGA